MSHGFTAIKEMGLDRFAERFTSTLNIGCLIYDNRGFGDSDVLPGQPRHEILPPVQNSDIGDAVTYAQSRPDVDPDHVGLWGVSYSGGHVLWSGAVDRRVKAVLSMFPCVSGWDTFHKLIRPDFVPALNLLFQQDRLARAKGKTPATMPAIDPDPLKPSALPMTEAYGFFSAWAKHTNWKNEVTVRSIEALRAYEPGEHISHLSPTPLLMTIAERDFAAPTDLALKAYARALEPKELHMVSCGHFDGFSDPMFETIARRQIDFLRKTLCRDG
ncbi:hypothetical protein AYO22_03878 [Fonsecaea multimorphosa]|nr:hypothetical protein AYO22_03878 [Fonsecaea multimorphosa]